MIMGNLLVNSTMLGNATGPGSAAGNLICHSIQVEKLHVQNQQLDLANLLQDIAVLIPPNNLDLSNPGIRSLYQHWQDQLDLARTAHQQLRVFQELLNTPKAN